MQGALHKIAHVRVRVLLVGLLLTGVLFALRYVSDKIFTPSAGPSAFGDMITLSLSIIIEATPFVLLGILVSIFVQVLLPDGWLLRHLPKSPGLRRACIASMGMFLPVCECGNVPVARGLIMQGFTVSESIVFLLAAPILNPITIITTQQAFGSDSTVLIARLLGGFAIAYGIGWLFSKHPRPDTLLTAGFRKQCEISAHHARDSRITKATQIFMRESRSMLPALIIGAGIAGAIQMVTPREFLLTVGSDPVLSILAMMALAFVVAICSNVDAFFALAFASSFSTGSLVSFLTFGAMIDIKMLALLRTTYTAQTLAYITVLVALSAGTIGLVVNYAF